jgi:nucleoside-diphosphate-sugar epimerase
VTYSTNFVRLTRNVSSDKAKALQAKGVEMVQADLNNKDELKRAFEHADVVFGITNFWDPEVLKNPSLEAKQGKNLADAAKENHVKWMLWSSLPNCAKGSGGKIKHVMHFDGNNSLSSSLLPTS